MRHREPGIGQRGITWLLFFRFSSLLVIICCRSFAEFGSSGARSGCWFLPLSPSHRILSILVVVVIDESRSGYVEKVNAGSGGVLAVRRRRRRVHHLRLSMSVFKRRWQRWMTATSLVLIFVVAMIVLVFDVPRRHFVVLDDKSVRVVQIRVRLRVAGERSRSAGHVHHLMMVKCSVSTGHFHALLGRVRRRVTRSIIRALGRNIIRGRPTRSHRTRGRRRHLLFLLQKILRRRRRLFALPLHVFRVHVSLFINRRSNSQDVLRPRFRILRLRVVVFV